MPTIIDNTAATSIVEVAGQLWSKATYSSYINYRSADNRFFVGQSFGKRWWLYNGGRKCPGVFDKPEQAMTFAAALSPKETSS